MNKKGMIQKVIITLIISLISLGLLGSIYFFTGQNAADASILTACRESIQLSEKTVGTIDTYEVGRFPLACVTQEVEIPNLRDKRDFKDTSEGVKQNIASLIVDTYYEFYDGKANKNVFGQYYKIDNRDKCFIAYNITVRDKHKVSASELVAYLKETNQFAVPVNPTISENEIKSTCEMNGGICSNAPGVNQVLYDKWSCPGRNKCYVYEKNMINYYDYIENTKLVKLYIDKEVIGTFNSNSEYALVFLSPTENANLEFSKKIAPVRFANYIYESVASVVNTDPSKFWGKSFIILTKMSKVSDYCISNTEK